MRAYCLIVYCPDSKHEPETILLSPEEIPFIPNVGDIYLNAGFRNQRRWRVTEREFSYDDERTTIRLLCEVA